MDKNTLLGKYPIVNEYRSLLEMLEKDVESFYESNDPMHKLNHVYEVIIHCLDLAVFDEHSKYLEKTYGDKSVTIPNILLAGFTHDIASDLKDMETRSRHHVIAGEYVLNNPLFRTYYTEDNLKIVSDAVIAHRASSSIRKFPSALAELFASGDRLHPKRTDVIARSLIWAEGSIRTPDLLNRTVNHLREKYGSTGYVTYPDFYRIRYGGDIKVLRKDIDELTIEHLLTYLKD